MSIRMLPPVGEAIRVRFDREAERRLLASWRPYQLSFYASGTAALAAAVTAVLAARPGRRKVLLPGYGCPALVSAVLHAGGQPVLIDLEPNRPWLALSELEANLDQSTAAVIAVNFLGIPERLDKLADLARAVGALLIDDSAQACPPSGLAEQWADFSILSFGRGKPASLLGGGAVLWRDPELANALPQPPIVAGRRWKVLAKTLVYNCLRQPWLYWIPQRLPLGLGATRYQPLAAITGIDSVRRQAVGNAIEQQLRRSAAIQRLVQNGPARSAIGLTDLAAACGDGLHLLRYPLLAPDASTRQRLRQALTRAGLGASVMYERVLPELPAMPAGLVHGDLTHARDFADRLLTLPVHAGVSSAQVRRMQQQIETVLQESKHSLSSTQLEKLG